MRRLYDGDIFEKDGREYLVQFSRDDFHGAPWKECDGHGRIRESFNYYGTPEKRAGEIVIHSNRGNHWIYDFAGTIKDARRDGWGLSADDLERLRADLGRAPTRREIVACAVRRDMEFCAAWLDNQWEYVVVNVSHVIRDDDDSFSIGENECIGGVETWRDYHMECAHDLADDLAHRLREMEDAEKREQIEREYWQSRDVLTK